VTKEVVKSPQRWGQVSKPELLDNGAIRFAAESVHGTVPLGSQCRA